MGMSFDPIELSVRNIFLAWAADFFPSLSSAKILIKPVESPFFHLQSKGTSSKHGIQMFQHHTPRSVEFVHHSLAPTPWPRRVQYGLLHARYYLYRIQLLQQPRCIQTYPALIILPHV